MIANVRRPPGGGGAVGESASAAIHGAHPVAVALGVPPARRLVLARVTVEDRARGAGRPRRSRRPAEQLVPGARPSSGGSSAASARTAPSVSSGATASPCARTRRGASARGRRRQPSMRARRSPRGRRCRRQWPAPGLRRLQRSATDCARRARPRAARGPGDDRVRRGRPRSSARERLARRRRAGGAGAARRARPRPPRTAPRDARARWPRHG